MYKSYGVLVGLLIAIMVTVNGTLARFFGDYVATVIIHMIGLTLVSIIVISKKLTVKMSRNIPIYWFAGGAIGAFMIIFNNMCFDKLGVSLTLALGLVGQIIASAIIDHYGLFGLNVSKFKKEKILGFITIFAGITIMVIY
ncbi:MAG TPA: DMT family transporter [Epulopiscium sp.]|nr:DMT family transporter [Candidatus Epulonipiscium sp.]